MALKAVDKADAETITKAISHGLGKGFGLSTDERRKKLVGIGTDGAAVMVGSKTGVVTRLKEGLPYVVGVHCMAHRIELAFKDAVKENTCHKQLDTLLMGLYYFYHNSPLNRANLRSSYDALGIKPALMPTQVGGTRWVSHQHRALDHFLRGYTAFLQHFEQIQSPDPTGVNKIQQAKARNLFKIAKSQDTVKFACFLFDILSPLSVLSTKMQKMTVSMAGVKKTLQSTKSVLLKYKTRPAPTLNNVKEASNSTSYKGITLTGSKAAFQSSSTKLLDGIVNSMENRFQDIEDSVLSSTCISEFSFWPDKNNMEDFGDLEVQRILDHFERPLLEAGVDVNKVCDEWTILKSKVYDSDNWVSELKSVSWKELNRKYFDECANILMLIDLLLCLPSTSAECERGFSRMKQVKTDWRSRLGSSTLTDLILVMLESPSIGHFNPNLAINLWSEDVVRPRRPDFLRKTAEVKLCSSSESDTHSEEEF